MLIALVVVSLLLLVQFSYHLYYKSQIKDISRQLAFISQNDSFKLIQSQLKPQEIFHLTQLCNTLLQQQRELNQQFIKKNEEINATITSLSHDIRTPLTSLDGYLQLVHSTTDGIVQQRYIDLAQSRVGQITTLIDELFLFTRLQNPDYTLKLQKLDAIERLKKSLLAAIDEISQIGDEPVIHLPEKASLIVGHEHGLERVFENILGNYIKHGKGNLTIEHEETEASLSIQFVNQLKDQNTIRMDKIFARFYKDDPSRSIHSSGLGLSIVKSLMEKMNGSVDAVLLDENFTIRITFKKGALE